MNVTKFEHPLSNPNNKIAFGLDLRYKFWRGDFCISTKKVTFMLSQEFFQTQQVVVTLFGNILSELIAHIDERLESITVRVNGKIHYRKSGQEFNEKEIEKKIEDFIRSTKILKTESNPYDSAILFQLHVVFPRLKRPVKEIPEEEKLKAKLTEKELKEIQKALSIPNKREEDTLVKKFQKAVDAHLLPFITGEKGEQEAANEDSLLIKLEAIKKGKLTSEELQIVLHRYLHFSGKRFLENETFKVNALLRRLSYLLNGNPEFNKKFKQDWFDALKPALQRDLGFSWNDSLETFANQIYEQINQRIIDCNDVAVSAYRDYFLRRCLREHAKLLMDKSR